MKSRLITIDDGHRTLLAVLATAQHLGATARSHMITHIIGGDPPDHTCTIDCSGFTAYNPSVLLIFEASMT